MFTRADSLGIRPVASTEATQRVASIADARQEAFDRFSSLSLGKLFKAEVVSSLTDGSFTVKIADTVVQMNLPAGAQVGDKLDMTLIANQPRPTFSMPAQAGNTAASDANLSQTGKLIDTLIRTAQAEGAPATLVGKTALVASPTASPSQVASALKNTLAYSGLFYESHVSQWATGSRSLTDLMREPQAKYSNSQLVAAALNFGSGKDADPTAATHSLAPGLTASDASPAETHVPSAAQLGPNPAAELNDPIPHAPTSSLSPLIESGNENTPPASMHGAPAASASTADTHIASNAPQSANAQNAIAADPQTDTSQTTAAKANTSPEVSSHTKIGDGSQSINATSTSNPRPEAMQSETARMVSLQLDTLEHQRVMWRGEVWPGQPMEWEVTEDAPDSHGPTGAEKSWQSVLRVELPSLGAVAATIRLTGQHVQVQMRAANESTAALLRSHGDKLASAMDAAGSPLDVLTVRQDASA